MPSSNKNVSFRINNKTKPLKTINIFDVFNQEEPNDESSLPPIDEIIWGKGFKSMINVSWADECGA